MKFQIELSHYASKAIRKGTIPKHELLDSIDKFIQWVEKKGINIDVKKMESNCCSVIKIE